MKLACQNIQKILLGHLVTRCIFEKLIVYFPELFIVVLIHLQKPLQQVQERLDFLAERRTEKLNRLQLVEKELGELEGPMAEAIVFLKDENKIIMNRNILYQCKMYVIYLTNFKICVCDNYFKTFDCCFKTQCTFSAVGSL